MNGGDGHERPSNRQHIDTMKLLCIGQSGQVAQALREQSILQDIDCACIGRPQADLTDTDSLNAALDRIAPSVVVNAAAYTAVDAAEQDEQVAFAVNADGPAILAAMCADRDLPFIHLSTDYVFDGTADRAYVETDPVSPLGVYGASKLAGEVAVRGAGPQHVILRTAWIYSPFGKNFVKTMLRLAKQNGAASVVDDQIGCPTNALDIADTILSMGRAISATPDPAQFGTFHYTNRGFCSWADVADLIFDAYTRRTGCKIELNRISTSEYPTPATRPLNSRLDTGKIEQIFGIEPKDWTMGVKQIVDRLIDEGL